MRESAAGRNDRPPPRFVRIDSTGDDEQSRAKVADCIDRELAVPGPGQYLSLPSSRQGVSKESEVDTSTEDVTINRLKQQFDSATRVVEAVAAGSIKVGEAQLRAASDAQKSIETARRKIEGTNDAQELWRIQNEWFTAGVQRSLAFWNEFSQAAAETQTTVSRYLYDPANALVQQAGVLPEASKTALELLDDAYRRWRDTTLQFWGATRSLAQDAENELQSAGEHRSRRNVEQGTGRKARQEA